MGAVAALAAAGVLLFEQAVVTPWRAFTAAGLLALVALACVMRQRREAAAALVALPVALALVPALPWTLAAIVAGLGVLAASLAFPAQGRSLVAAGVVLGLAVAATGAVALAFERLVDAATPTLWAPVAALLLIPLLVVTTRRFLAPEATA